MYKLGGEGIIDKSRELTDERKIEVIKFESKRKRASIVIRNPNLEGSENEVRIFCKGAPDFVINDTVNVVTADGLVGIDEEVAVPQDLKFEEDGEEAMDTHRGLLERTVRKFANQAYRTLLITYRDMSMADYEQLKADNNNFEDEKDKLVLE